MAGPQSVSTERKARLQEMPWLDVNVQRNFVNGTVASVREVWSHRELLGMLTRRELKARYKDSALGFLWSLARPLTQLVIYYVVVGKFLGAARSIDNFAIFIFAGLTVYTLFSEIVATGTGAILANAGLVQKVYLPREIFPLATIGSSLFNFLIQLVILIIVAIPAGTLHFGPQLLYGVGALVIVLLYAGALAIVLSAWNVYLRDVSYLVEVVLLLMMWASPIVYSWQFVKSAISSWALEIYMANPVTLAVLGFQKAFWTDASGGTSPDHLALRMLIAGVVGAVLLLACHRVFSKLQGNFAQEL
ncbi:ABC transporter permease [Cryobacterium zhongshanensis]|uniref:Transport permease protein n=1 Tax=Cryobacterium zhongshanensis TaxID=2928153 RepID=A0AA41QWL9_9MICO|nr:ABC transporter permease [Cryobacterium zhongshanensis]MCI4658398.1 ABC transporter permease [Cryobacterium zhongshanensis]